MTCAAGFGTNASQRAAPALLAALRPAHAVRMPMSLPSDSIDYTGPDLSLELWDALGQPAALPPGLYWVPGKTAAWEEGDGWELALFADPPDLADGSLRRAFS